MDNREGFHEFQVFKCCNNPSTPQQPCNNLHAFCAPPTQQRNHQSRVRRLSAAFVETWVLHTCGHGGRRHHDETQPPRTTKLWVHDDADASTPGAEAVKPRFVARMETPTVPAHSGWLQRWCAVVGIGGQVSHSNNSTVFTRCSSRPVARTHEVMVAAAAAAAAADAATTTSAWGEAMQMFTRIVTVDRGHRRRHRRCRSLSSWAVVVVGGGGQLWVVVDHSRCGCCRSWATRVVQQRRHRSVKFSGAVVNSVDRYSVPG